MKHSSLVKHHAKGGAYLKDVVYGANDGIITTFAIVAGVAGAGVENTIVILLGLANLFADGFSMAASNYLGSKSERAYILRERVAEELELTEEPKVEHAEMFGFLRRKGYAKKDTEALLPLLSKNKEFWLDVMMQEELGIAPLDANSTPIRAASATFFSFTAAGAVPLIPYFFISTGSVFTVAACSTAAMLFIVGASRSLLTGQRWYLAGLEMLFVGGIASLIAYGVGYGVSLVV